MSNSNSNSNMLSVAGIKHGTVIDHITAGQSLRIIHLLNLHQSSFKVTIGLNLPSKLLGKKDLIKIEDRILTPSEANEIVVFADTTTINVIENFKITNKITTHLPSEIKKVFLCANPACVTYAASIESWFHIQTSSKNIQLVCHYCEAVFERDQVKVRI
jgi:aspartate carbamoyltransferase regulatory subunit